MAEVEIEIPIEDEVLASIESICRELGITVNDMFNVFAREFVAHRGFPFEVTEEEIKAVRQLEKSHG